MRASVFALTIGLLVGFFVPFARAGEVSGPFANRLSQSDVVQIKAAITKQAGISHNLKKIEAIRPEKVSIQTTTRSAVDQDTLYDFNAYKRSGTWTIDASSIQVTIEQRDFRTNGRPTS